MRVLRAPSGPYVMNASSIQARGLKYWWPTMPGVPTKLLLNRSPRNGSTANFTCYNDAILTQNDELRGAITFDGSGDYAAAPISCFQSLGSPGSACLWLNLRAWGGEHLYEAAWGHNNFSCNGPSAAGASVVFNVGQNVNFSTTYTGYSLNTWYFLCVSWDGVNGKTWVNGSPDNTVAYTGVPGAASKATQLGRQLWQNGYATAYMNGLLADVRLYERVLNDDEVWQMWDPLTRWDLYQLLRPPLAYSTGAPPAGRRRSSVIWIG